VTTTAPDLKLPQDPQAAQALQDYLAAVALYARRRELVEKAKQSLPEAAASVETAHARCVELGLLPPANGKPRAAARREGPTQRERILEALPSTTAELRERTGIGAQTLSATLHQLAKAGQVVGEGERGSKVWRRA